MLNVVNKKDIERGFKSTMGGSSTAWGYEPDNNYHIFSVPDNTSMKEYDRYINDLLNTYAHPQENKERNGTMSNSTTVEGPFVDFIRQAYNKYSQEGEISAGVLDTINEVYEDYKNKYNPQADTDNNDICHKMMEYLHELPIKKGTQKISDGDNRENDIAYRMLTGELPLASAGISPVSYFYKDMQTKNIMVSIINIDHDHMDWFHKRMMSKFLLSAVGSDIGLASIEGVKEGLGINTYQDLLRNYIGLLYEYVQRHFDRSKSINNAGWRYIFYEPDFIGFTRYYLIRIMELLGLDYQSYYFYGIPRNTKRGNFCEGIYRHDIYKQTMDSIVEINSMLQLGSLYLPGTRMRAIFEKWFDIYHEFTMLWIDFKTLTFDPLKEFHKECNFIDHDSPLAKVLRGIRSYGVYYRNNRIVWMADRVESILTQMELLIKWIQFKDKWPSKVIEYSERNIDQEFNYLKNSLSIEWKQMVTYMYQNQKIRSAMHCSRTAGTFCRMPLLSDMELMLKKFTLDVRKHSLSPTPYPENKDGKPILPY